MQETWVRSLGGEDPLEKERTTHFSILAWRILWTEEPGGLWKEAASESEAGFKIDEEQRGTELYVSWH